MKPNLPHYAQHDNPQGKPFRLEPILNTPGAAGTLGITCFATGTRAIWNEAAASGWHYDMNGQPGVAYYSPIASAYITEAARRRKEGKKRMREKELAKVGKRQYSVRGQLTMTGDGHAAHAFFKAFNALCEAHGVKASDGVCVGLGVTLTRFDDKLTEIAKPDGWNV